jgi:hypothetical protein
MPSTEYHHRQAETLLRLAALARESETAAELRALAADHVALADERDAAVEVALHDLVSNSPPRWHPFAARH